MRFAALIMKFISQKKNRKLWTLEKLENMMKKKCFFSRKKRFHLSKLHLYQIGKAQNMRVEAGRLVQFSYLQALSHALKLFQSFQKIPKSF